MARPPLKPIDVFLVAPIFEKVNQLLMKSITGLINFKCGGCGGQ
jgi:hypothetical protein